MDWIGWSILGFIAFLAIVELSWRWSHRPPSQQPSQIDRLTTGEDIVPPPGFPEKLDDLLD